VPPGAESHLPLDLIKEIEALDGDDDGDDGKLSPAEFTMAIKAVAMVYRDVHVKCPTGEPQDHVDSDDLVEFVLAYDGTRPVLKGLYKPDETLVIKTHENEDNCCDWEAVGNLPPSFLERGRGLAAWLLAALLLCFVALCAKTRLTPWRIARFAYKASGPWRPCLHSWP
jgi:hypothetical protein